MTLDMVGTSALALAILHTFSVKRLQNWSHSFPKGSALCNLLHLLAEVEVVMGLWAGLFMAYLAATQGYEEFVKYISGLNFTEPAFVFVVMSVCSTRPVLLLSQKLIFLIARMIPLKKPVAFYAVTLVLGPLLGSLVTEPAAMTITALLLLQHLYGHNVSNNLKYATVGLLFVNVSVGGVMTSFAAPPVLMVASTWHWDSLFMLTNFGWKGALACVLSTAVTVAWFYKELARLPVKMEADKKRSVPLWVSLLHLGALGLIVLSSHHMIVFMWMFLFFLGLVSVTEEHQSQLKLREGLLVAFFLSGLVVLGPSQAWWLSPVVAHLETWQLYLSAAGLTAFTDNAALTYLGSQIPTIADASKYALVAGAIVGGGLTVIANAPNPAGYGILNSSFDGDGISPFALFVSALPYTLIAGLCFWFL
jgi:hypothetical protein